MLRHLRRAPGFYKRLFLLALPLILQNLITTSLGFVDTFMVGMLGQNELSAVTAANTPIYMLQIIILGLLSGLTVLSSQYWGKGDTENINRCMGVSLYAGLLIAVSVAAVLFCSPLQVMSLVTNNALLIQLGAPYLKIVGISYIFNTISSVYIGMQRSTENPALGMVVFGISMLTNTCLNYILIFGKFGCPEMGIAGAAIASVAAEAISLLFYLLYVKFRVNTAQYGRNLHNYRRDRAALRSFLTGTGIPAEEADRIINAVNSAENDADFVDKLSVLKASLDSKYAETNPRATEAELAEFREKSNRAVTAYFSSAAAYNGTVSDLNSRIARMTPEEQAAIRASFDIYTRRARSRADFARALSEEYRLTPGEINAILQKEDNGSLTPQETEIRERVQDFLAKEQIADAAQAEIARQMNATTGKVQNVAVDGSSSPSIVKAGCLTLVQNPDGTLTVDRDSSDDVITVADPDGGNPRQISLSQITSVLGEADTASLMDEAEASASREVDNARAFPVGTLVADTGGNWAAVTATTPDGVTLQALMPDGTPAPPFTVPNGRLSEITPVSLRPGTRLGDIEIASAAPGGIVLRGADGAELPDTYASPAALLPLLRQSGVTPAAVLQPQATDAAQHQPSTDPLPRASSASPELPPTGRSLTQDEAASVISAMEARALPAPELPLTPENWTAQFGSDGIVPTPIGNVKMGENQLAKLFIKKREKEFGMIRPTLTDPDIIIEEESPADGASRPTSYLFVKAFNKGGRRIVMYENVTVSQDGMEVSVSSHEIRGNQLRKSMEKGKLLYISTDLDTSGQASSEQHPKADSGTVQEHTTVRVPDSKDTKNNGTPQYPTDKKGEPDFVKMDYGTVSSLISRLGDTVASRFISNNIEAARKALTKARRRLETATGYNALLLAQAEANTAEIRLSWWEGFRRYTDTQKEADAAARLSSPQEAEDYAVQSLDPIHIAAEYRREKETATPEAALSPWQRDLLGTKITTRSFDRFADRNLRTQSLARAWLSDTDGRAADAVAQELSTIHGVEVTPQMVVDFIVDNPTGSVPKTTQRMRDLDARFKELAARDGYKTGGIESETGRMYLRMRQLQREADALRNSAESEAQPLENTAENATFAEENDNGNGTQVSDGGAPHKQREGDGVSQPSAQSGRAGGDSQSEQNARGLREAIEGKSRDEAHRVAEQWARDNGLWHDYAALDLGTPFRSGNENDTYLSPDGNTIYKINNLMNSRGDLAALLDRVALHNSLFPETAYEFVGLAGFGSGQVYPIFKQRYIPENTFATEAEIDAYMRSIGFTSTGREAEYSNGQYTVGDLRPRNVLKDAEGNIYVIDAEITDSRNAAGEEAVAADDTVAGDDTVQDISPVDDTDTGTDWLDRAWEDRTPLPFRMGSPARQALAERRATAERALKGMNIGSAEVTYIETPDSIADREAKAAIEAGAPVSGWYSPTSDTVYIYLPNVTTANEMRKTLLHELVAHKGLRGLLGREAFDSLCDSVWDTMDDTSRRQYAAYILYQDRAHPISDSEMRLFAADAGQRRAAADEYMAFFAEDGEKGRLSAWQKVRGLVKEALRRIGIRVRLTDADIAYLLYRSRRRLSGENATPLERFMDEGMRNRVRRSLSDPSASRALGFSSPMSVPDMEAARLRIVPAGNEWDVTPEAYGEMQEIKARAISGGTFMKAPNGADTRLTERQWLQVRTAPFKAWFGDWEKAARIEKLRHSKPLIVSGNDYQGKYELNSKSAEGYILNTLRGQYINKDTGNTVNITRASRKVAHHDAENDVHLKSIAYIPQMIENAVFIDEIANEKGTKFDSYRYYVVGLKIDGVDYTAKLVVGQNNGESYYDHALTEIEKSDLLSLTDGVEADVSDKEDAVPEYKDRRLISILQTNASKVVDGNGEPKVVKHGTPNTFTAFDKARIGSSTDAGWLGSGFYFYGNADEYAGQYSHGGSVMELFLNVRDPYPASYSEMEELAEKNDREASDDFTAQVTDEGHDGVYYNEDLNEEWVVYEPSQIKSATDNNGEFSDEDNDIRFRVAQPVEQSGDLIAVHNLSEEKLRGAFGLGGLPMPSIAITKAEAGHTEFGDISLVFGKESIDPADRRNRVYGEDAWTPTFPTIGYKLNEDKTDDIYRRANRAGSLPLFNPVYFHPDNYERYISGLGSESLVGHFKEDYGAKQLYLSEQGNPVGQFEQHEVDKYLPDQIALYEKLLNGIGLERLKGERNDALEDEVKQLVSEHYGIDFSVMKPFRVKARIHNTINRAIDYAENGNKKTESDIEATKKKIDERIDQGKFRSWLEELFDGVVEKAGIRNEREQFTPSGSSRKWEVLYDEITLDNVVKAMQRQAARGGQGLFGGSIFGAAQEEYKSIDDIRKAAQERIRSISHEEYEAQRKAIIDRLSAIEIPGAGERVSDTMDMVQNIQDAVARSHTPTGIHRYLKEFYPDVTMETAGEIADIVKDIQQLSARYFEAKPYRAVGFSEVRLAVVPEGTAADITSALSDYGIPVETYPKGDNARRAEVLNRAAGSLGIRFRMAYHGSPHDFDRFDHSHMGTGEGAQAYGWGTYVTEVNGIARAYASTPARAHVSFSGDKKKLGEGLTYPYVVDDVIEDIKGMMQRGSTLDEAASRARRYWNNPFEPTHPDMRRVLSRLKAVDFTTNRNLYTVDIPDDNGDNYLRWDGRADMVIDRAGVTIEEFEENDMVSGGDVYHYLAKKLGSDRAASEYLHDRGFVGISYPAQYTMGGRADNARNYVIFNEDDVRITDHVRFRITPQEDAEYLDAVRSGDMEKAQHMVDMAAEQAGYSPDSGYQGYMAFNGAAPSSNAYFETKEERKEAWNNGEFEGDFSLGDFIDNGIDTNDLAWQINDARAIRNKPAYTEESIRNLRSTVKSASRKIKMYRAVDSNIEEDGFRNGDWITPSRSYAEHHISLNGHWNGGRIIEQDVSVDNIWWDGNDINEWGYDDGNGYVYKNTPNNRKLAAVTYDDSGNVIPLSERFNETVGDVRFRITPELRQANERFNEELERYMDGKMRSSDIFNLGVPSDILKAAGINGNEIVMTQNVLREHLDKHGLTAADIKDLPLHLQAPLMIYEWGNKAKSAVVITDMPKGNDRITAAIRTSTNGKEIEISRIASVHPKSVERLLNEMNTDKSDFAKDNLRYVDKSKALDWIAMVSPKETSQPGQGLNSDTKIDNNSDNTNSRGKEKALGHPRISALSAEAQDNQGLTPDAKVGNISETPNDRGKKTASAVQVIQNFHNPKLPGENDITEEEREADNLRYRIANDPAAVYPEPQRREGETLLAFFRRYGKWREKKIAYEQITGENIPLLPRLRPGESLTEWFKAYHDYTLGVEDAQAVSEHMRNVQKSAGRLRQWQVRWTDCFINLKKFKEEMQAAGAEISPDDDFYNAVFLTPFKITRATEKFRTREWRDLLSALARFTSSEGIGNIELRWQNLDNEELKKEKERRNGTRLTPREIADVYVQAKDIEEAVQLGLPDRGADGFIKNLGVAHTDVIRMVEDNIPSGTIGSLWDSIRAATGFALDYEAEHGVISRETREKYRSRKYYVPERGWVERDMDGRRTNYTRHGGDYGSPYNPALVRAQGRTSIASSPFPYIQSIAESAIRESELNTEKLAFKRFAEKNEAIGVKTGAFEFSEAWLVNKRDDSGNVILTHDGKPLTEVTYARPTVEMFAHDREADEKIREMRKDIAAKQRQLEKTGERIAKAESPSVELYDRRDALARDIASLEQQIASLENSKYIAGYVRDEDIPRRTLNEKRQHAVHVRENGRDYVIRLESENVANAVNRRFDSDRSAFIDGMADTLARGTRLMASWNTQYNPGFAVANLLRDFQFAMLINDATRGGRYAARFARNTFTAMGAIHAYASGNEDSYTGKHSQYLKEFLDSGALTGYSFTKPVRDMAKDFDRELKRAEKAGRFADRDDGSRGYAIMRFMRDNASRESVARAAGYLSVMSEMAVRFGEYITARQSGCGVQEAASRAKEVSTNFDRHGLYGQRMNRLFAYFNATLQGSVRVAYAYLQNPRAAARLAAFSLLYTAAGFLNTMLNPDDPDDEVYLSDYTRMTNLTLGNWRVPMPHYFRMFFALGVQAALAWQGRKPWEQAVTDTVQFIAGDLLPGALNLTEGFHFNSTTGRIGYDMEQQLRAMMPTVVSPIADVGLNMNFMGLPIAREPFLSTDEGKFSAVNMYNSRTAAPFRYLSDAILEITGGSPDLRYKAGGLDVNPSYIEHIVSGYTPGLVKDIVSLAAMTLPGSGNSLDWAHIPVAGRFYSRRDPESAYRSQYWQLKNSIDFYRLQLRDSRRNDRRRYREMLSSPRHEVYLRTQRILRRMDTPAAGEEASFSPADIRLLMDANAAWVLEDASVIE